MSDAASKLRAISRRSFLQGAGNVMISLPFLEFMASSSAEAQALSPLRYIIVHNGSSIGKSQKSFFAPSTTGANWTASPALMPINNYPNLRPYLTTITNLAIPEERNGITRAGPRVLNATTEWHYYGELTQLRATRNGVSGASSDQILKMNLNLGSQFLHMNYAVQPKRYGGDGVGSGPLQFDASDNSISPTWDPLVAFNNLTSGLVAGDKTQDAVRLKALTDRKSVLDLVDKRRLEYLTKLAGAEAKQQLSTHFDKLRDLEVQIQTNINSTSSGTSGCKVIASPSSLQLGQDKDGSAYPTAANSLYCWSNETLRSKIFREMTAMAVSCDRSRIGTIKLTHDSSMLNANQLSTSFSTPLRDLHEVSHSEGTDEDLAKCTAWHVNEFLALGELLRNTPEGTGNVLDNTVILFLSAGGHSDVGPHTGDNMAVLLLGKAGGIKTGGQHIKANKENPCEVMLAAMKCAGYTGTSFNEVKMAFPGLT